MKNKLSVWALIILIATILSTILLVTTIVVTAVGTTAVAAAAKQAAIDTGSTPDEAQLIASVAVGAIIVALVFSSIFDVLKIIGGFMFSLKGRWGVFCIVVSLLSVAGAVWSLISDISNKAGVGTIVLAVVSLLLNLLLCVACFMHRKEVQQQ